MATFTIDGVDPVDCPLTAGSVDTIDVETPGLVIIESCSDLPVTVTYALDDTPSDPATSATAGSDSPLADVGYTGPGRLVDPVPAANGTPAPNGVSGDRWGTAPLGRWRQFNRGGTIALERRGDRILVGHELAAGETLTIKVRSAAASGATVLPHFVRVLPATADAKILAGI